jgi:hypothetical protein
MAALGQPGVGAARAGQAPLGQAVTDQDELAVGNEVETTGFRFRTQCPPPTYSSAIASASTSDTSPANDTLPRLSRYT